VNTDFLPGNQLTLLESGAEYFPALRAEIDAARHEIHLETYIFEDDVSGQEVASALANASRRGVAVRLLVDGFGARGFETGLGASLVAAGVELLVYRPEMGRLVLRRHRLRRLHRKLSVFDGRVAFVGGINVIDDMNTPHQLPPRFDYAVRIEGPLVQRVHYALRHLWRLVRWSMLGRRPPAPTPLHPPLVQCGEVSAGFLIRDNLRHRRDIENAYLAAIDAARHEVLIANAYFLPGFRFRSTLIRAAKRGVRVTLLLQGRIEYVLLHYASFSLYGLLLAAGVRIVEYRVSFLHAKVAVIDGEWATVGSSNIDPFSLLLAREANIVVRDRGFAGELHTSLQQAMTQGGEEIDAADLARRPWYARIASRIAYMAVRLLMGMTGYLRREYRGKVEGIARRRGAKK
jgi:cardiolipin synthase